MYMCIEEVFKGKRIFVTGGSGFIGKALIEKLLRSCDGIEAIYVLLRKKKGLSIEERLKIITENELFDKLKKQDPDALKKLVPIYGDAKECRLGMSENDRRTIIENVNVIYHAAASVRFDDHLKDSLLLNTRGTREVANLASEVKNLEAFMHISTTYCNTDKKVVEEKIYPAHMNWRSAIEVAEKFDQHTLNVIAPKYIDPLTNTYTFAKSLGEHVVNDLSKGKIPAVIFRPSIVISTYKDPICGWIDNFNGPVGLLIAGSKGLLKTCYGYSEAQQDYIPVDIVIKMLIIATRDRIINKDLNDVPVYNSCVGNSTVFKNKQVVELGAKLTWDVPLSKIFWYPSFMMTNNWYLYYIVYLIYHMLPALLVDGLLKISGRKPILTKIQRKIYIANVALIYFMQNSWTFTNDNSFRLTDKILDCDRDKFSFKDVISVSDQDVYAFYIRGKIGAMKYLFKEDFNIDNGYRITMIMWILDFILHYTIYAIGCWYLYAKVGILTILCNKCNNILIYWNNL